MINLSEDGMVLVLLAVGSAAVDWSGLAVDWSGLEVHFGQTEHWERGSANESRRGGRGRCAATRHFCLQETILYVIVFI